MKIQTHGKQIDVGDALRSHVENQLSLMIAKYSARPIEAIVTFSKDMRCKRSKPFGASISNLYFYANPAVDYAGGF